MRFTTASGSTYEILEVEETDRYFTGYLVRDGVPLKDFDTGLEMSELHAQPITFVMPPTVGARFSYGTKTHGLCISTEVVSIEENEAAA